MNVTETPEIVRGEIVPVGRRGVRARLIEILGEDFLQFGDGLRKPCGYCDGGYSGTKTAHLNVFAGECFQCGGTGVGSDAITEEKALKLAKNRIAARKRTARKAAEKAAAAEKVGADWRAANPDVAALGEAIYAEMAEAGYEGHMDVDARWGGRATHLANLVGMGRALTAEQTTELPVEVAKALDTQVAEQARQDAARYFGTQGDKLVATGRIVVSTTIEVPSFNGYSTDLKRLVIIEGTGEFTGVTFKVFSTAKAIWETERGQFVEVKATVKRHAEYEGVKQTELTYAKVTVVG